MKVLGWRNPDILIVDRVPQSWHSYIRITKAELWLATIGSQMLLSPNLMNGFMRPECKLDREQVFDLYDFFISLVILVIRVQFSLPSIMKNKNVDICLPIYEKI